MNTSAAIADPLLRQAFGWRARPSDPHRTARVCLGTSGLVRQSRDAAQRFRDEAFINNAGWQDAEKGAG
jgi:hypothetical protein